MTIVTRMNASVSANPSLIPQPTKTGASWGAIVRGAEAGGDEARERDADLAGSEVPVRVRREGRQPTTASALLLRQSADLRLAQRDERQLGRGEEAAEEHEEQHHGDVDPQVAHAMEHYCPS